MYPGTYEIIQDNTKKQLHYSTHDSVVRFKNNSKHQYKQQ